MKKWLSLLLAGFMVFGLAACGSSDSSADNKDKTEENVETEESVDEENMPGSVEGGQKYLAVITVKDRGTIEVELDEGIAPETVKNFVKLANEGFYDGLTFHRVIDGFMIQGGDPNGDGTGGADEDIKGEFKSNGFNNTLKHTRGVISMARSADPDSASSQFFIMHEDAPHLDGEYAAFGKVISGMDIVDDIAENTSVSDANGTVEKKDQPVIESITVTEE